MMVDNYWGLTHKEFDPGHFVLYKKVFFSARFEQERKFLAHQNFLAQSFEKFRLEHFVYESLMPYVEAEKGPYDRITFVAVKNPRFKKFFQVPAPQDFASGNDRRKSFRISWQGSSLMTTKEIL